MTDHLFRVLVTEYPEGSTKPGWEPSGWPDSYPDAAVGDDAFRWPATDHVYRSRSGAQRRRRLVESYGAKAVVQKSGPVAWPEGHAEAPPIEPVAAEELSLDSIRSVLREEVGGIARRFADSLTEPSPVVGEFDSPSPGVGRATGVPPSAPVAVAEPSWMDRPDAVVLHADGKLTWLAGGGHAEISDLVADQIPEATSNRFRDDDPYLIWSQDAVGLPLNPLADRVVQEVDQIKQAFGWRGDIAISRAGEEPLTVEDCELIERIHTAHSGSVA